MNDTHLEILMQALWEHREAFLPKKPTTPTKAEICSSIETLSKNMCHETMVLQCMSFLPNQHHNPFAKQLLLPLVEPPTLYPTKADEKSTLEPYNTLTSTGMRPLSSPTKTKSLYHYDFEVASFQ
jgi:hypothetical protein